MRCISPHPSSSILPPPTHTHTDIHTHGRRKRERKQEEEDRKIRKKVISNSRSSNAKGRSMRNEKRTNFKEQKGK